MVVVVAGVVEREGKLMLYRRPEGKKNAGLWEFPGGKIEEGESPEQALARELMEELAMEVEVGGIIDALPIVDMPGYLLLFYRCKSTSQPAPQEGGYVEFAAVDELCRYAFAPSDSAFVQRLTKTQ